ncbi:hypothetical protein GALMADRAFT_245532 [Galerina marginata CBS 339.88]|uniref:Uncharacterized protein n=1 Tax=Galerina marginata (strain CBS 339.88) TaxID=685588 RepID=A0A067T7P0_GALM3|nr:hypothetical protein GALMADRAFT_245532 [Galerina marginata CBS 339.88]
MSNTLFLPSHFGASFLTTIPETRYDAKGRQLGFIESEVQRLERLAFLNASKSRSNSPNHSPRSGASSPTKLISEPYGDPIELMANQLAEKFMMNEFSSPYDELQVLYSTPKSGQRLPPSVSYAPQSRKAPSPSTSFQPGHRRSRSSLSSIPEED